MDDLVQHLSLPFFQRGVSLIVYAYMQSSLLNRIIIISFMSVAPPPPTGLTVEVNESNVELKWNNASAHHNIDFYRVEVYMIKAGNVMMLHESLEKDTHEHVVLYHTTGTLIANVSSYNRCGQMSRGSASMSFMIQGKLYSSGMHVKIISVHCPISISMSKGMFEGQNWNEWYNPGQCQ